MSISPAPVFGLAPTRIAPVPAFAGDPRSGVEPSTPRTACLAFVATPSAVVDVRGWTDGVMRGFGVRSFTARDDAVLVVSELVSNAVRHGVAPVTLTLTHASDHVRISVADNGLPPYAFDDLTFEPGAAHGRGLVIIAALTATWGITPHDPGPGKAVWCLLHTTTGPDPTPTAATR